MEEKMQTSKEEEAPDYHEMFSMQDWHYEQLVARA
jgi:hypothetical protein